MQHVESSFAGVHGTRIVYDVWTPDVAADNPPTGVLVLAHGLAEHAGRYRHVIERLGSLGLVVYAPDHRGHGRSGGKRVSLAKWSDFTDDLHTLFSIAADEHPGSRTFLLGHSMGGAIALSYALDHQGDLDALMLSGPAVNPSVGQPKALVAVGAVLGRFLPSLPVLKLDPNDVSRDKAVVDAYVADPLGYHGSVTAGLAAALLQESRTYPARLPSLTIPVLLQHGTADRLADVSGSELIAELAGSEDLTLKTYDGLFHEVFNEPEQERVLDDLITWLRPRVGGGAVSS
ncbi:MULTISPECIES: alpha/beta hydrolase [Nocardiaceae]|uniref:alpha/beta hydrolase n=1 Tax=Nocardiaceae TaxID=85025 RepID=UPI00050CD67B|nr:MULTISPECIES: alpha/beta hydrolase [Rhodococcus]MBW4779719.1 lysophospholipase [Rhodococcus fascians]MDJ0002503.1 alpha/beta hydrolase [Rhodococcus fascians]MDJ0468495.1 alpha/beta hydrolase [Rhodococcus fascians]